MSTLVATTITPAVDRVAVRPATASALQQPVNQIAKRALDLAGAVAALIVLAPVMLLIAALVKLVEPAAPVFYRQNRVGRGGESVGVLKFRSMSWAYSTGADRPFATAVEAFRAMGREDLCAEFELTQKVADDPRVSALGRFLRKTSLDELPQFLNVLVGDLSLVGPRPIIPAELERYGDAGVDYLSVKPGITGLWQISGRSDTGYGERVRLDVRYVRTWRFALDLIVLVKTVRVVLAREGAY